MGCAILRFYCRYKMSIEFNNDYRMSIISGEGAYSTIIENTYEIAIIKDGKWVLELYEPEHKGDDIIGHLPSKDVIKYINKISKIGTKNEVNNI